MPSTFRADWQPTSQNQVIGESYGDGRFIEAVMRAHGGASFDFTTPLGADERPIGKSGFKRHLSAMRFFVEREMVSRIVVVGDNDDDHAKAFQEVRRAFQDAGGYPTPAPRPATVTSGGGLRLGILMMPGTDQSGCLETLLLKGALRDPRVTGCVDTWATCCGFPTVPRNVYDKFLVHSILAASLRQKPNLTLPAIWQQADNPFDPADQAFAWIAEFLNTVFI